MGSLCLNVALVTLFILKSKMRLLLSSVAAILLLGTFGLTGAVRSSALEARRLSDHPVMRSARRTFVDEVADYLHSIDRQARSHFTEIFGVNSNDAVKALLGKIFEWVAFLLVELIFKSP